MARDGDRHQPLPPLTRLPRHFWERLPKAGQIALLAIAGAAIVAAVLAAPGIRASKEEAEARERREAAAQRARKVRRLRALVAPRRAAVPAAPAGLSRPTRLDRRERAVTALGRQIAVDARERTGKPIVATTCERYPRSERPRPSPARDLEAARVRVSCLAATARFQAGAGVSVGGSLGYPYRALVDFAAGRVAFCRVFGRPAEGALTRRIPVRTPTACGG